MKLERQGLHAPARPCGTALYVQSALRCLTSRWSLAAIGLLLANDHLLKRLWPSWLTGKLSDLAGLYFAPFLLLLPAFGLIYPAQILAGRRRREPPELSERAAQAVAGLVFAATGACFAALKLPLTAAPALRLLRALLGWPGIVVADTTDLVALAVLLPAYRAWRRRSAAACASAESQATPYRLRRPWRSVGRLAVLALATLAVTATSPIPLPCLQLMGLAIEPSDPDVLYATKVGYEDCYRAVIAASPDRRLYISRDAGSTWEEAGPGGERVLPDPTQPGILYFSNSDGLARLDLATGAWAAIEPPELPARELEQAFPPYGAGGTRARYGLGLPLIVSPWGTRVLYVGVHDAVARSADGGATWDVLPLPGHLDAEVDCLAAAPSQPGLLFAFEDGHLYRSDDAGDAWREVSEWGWSPSVLYVHPADPAVLLAGTDKRILLSEDGGNSWREVWWSSEGGTAVWTISFDPQAPDTTYAAAGHDGLLVSTDGGRTWQQELDSNIVDVAISADSRVYAARQLLAVPGLTLGGPQRDGIYRQRRTPGLPWQGEWELVDRGLRAPRRAEDQPTPTARPCCP